MSQVDHGDGDRDDGDHDRTPVPDDLDKWKDHQRLRTIFEARRTANDDIQEAGNFADFYEQPRKRILKVRAFRSVKAYIREIEPMLLTRQDGKYLPREKAVRYWRREYLGSVELPGDNGIAEWVGLKDVLGEPAQRKVTWTEEERDPIDGLVENQYAEWVAVPIAVSEAAYRCANRFLSDVGYEANVDFETDDEWEV